MLSGILEHIACDGVVVLSHKDGVLKSSCHAQEFLQQEFSALTQEAFGEVTLSAFQRLPRVLRKPEIPPAFSFTEYFCELSDGRLNRAHGRFVHKPSIMWPLM